MELETYTVGGSNNSKGRYQTQVNRKWNQDLKIGHSWKLICLPIEADVFVKSSYMCFYGRFHGRICWLCKFGDSQWITFRRS